jgi:ABC-type Na+ efflux pump permease subunit
MEIMDVSLSLANVNVSEVNVSVSEANVSVSVSEANTNANTNATTDAPTTYEQMKIDELRKVATDKNLAPKEEIKRMKKPELLVLLKK